MLVVAQGGQQPTETLQAAETASKLATTDSGHSSISGQVSNASTTDSDILPNAQLTRLFVIQQHAAHKYGPSRHLGDAEKVQNRAFQVDTVPLDAAKKGTSIFAISTEDIDVDTLLAALQNGQIAFSIEEFTLNPADQAMLDSQQLPGVWLNEDATEQFGGLIRPFAQGNAVAATSEVPRIAGLPLKSTEEIGNELLIDLPRIAELNQGDPKDGDITTALMPESQVGNESNAVAVDDALSTGTESLAANDSSGAGGNSGTGADSRQMMSTNDFAPSIGTAVGASSAAGGASFADVVSSEIRLPVSNQVSQAIYDHVQRNGNVDKSTLTMRLDPPDLGELQISITRTDEGMAIRVTAREQVTMDMLLARGQEIEKQLQQTDIDMAAIEFTAPDSGSGWNRDSSQRDDGTQENSHLPGVSRIGRRAVSVAQQTDTIEGRTAQIANGPGRMSFRA